MFYLVEKNCPYKIKGKYNTKEKAEKAHNKYWYGEGFILLNPYKIVTEEQYETKEKYEERLRKLEEENRAFRKMVVENSKKDHTIKMVGCW